MSKRIATALTALGVLVVIGGVALATPGSGITPTTHVDRATLADSVRVEDDVDGSEIEFKTKGAVDVRVQTLRFAPGATTGWHSHPGFAIISVTQGTLTLYAPDCSSRTYSAGESFLEDRHTAMVARNETAAEAVSVVTFVAPGGVASFRIDQPNPGCAVS